MVGERRREGAVVEPEAPARDPDPARAEPVAEMRDRAGPEGDVDARVELEDALALRLGVAAADRDHALRILALARERVAEVGGELRVGLLPDRARVEDDDIGLVGARGLAESELLEQTLDPLRVVGVHLAAESGDVVAAHGPGRVAATPGSAHGVGVEPGEPQGVRKPAQVDHCLDEGERDRYLSRTRAHDDEERDEEDGVPHLPLVDGEDEQQRESDARRAPETLLEQHDAEYDSAGDEIEQTTFDQSRMHRDYAF